jgi:hypothetical protein
VQQGGEIQLDYWKMTAIVPVFGLEQKLEKIG